MKQGVPFKIKIQNFIKRHDIAIMSILLNAFIMLIMLLLFEPFFDSNDDPAMRNIVDGSKGTYDPHLIFINCAIGYLLRWLYMTFPVIPWYTVLQYIVIFVSSTVFTHIMWRRLRPPYCRCAFLVLLVTVSYQNYIMFQFSRTATIATIAGVLMLLTGFFEKKVSVKWLACGYILALVGSMYRFLQFFVVTALLSGIGLFYLLRFIKEEKKWKKYLIQNIGIFAVLFVLVFGMYYWDQQQYRTEEWKNYKEFNSLRAELWDYGFPDYKEHKKEYNALGVDSTTVDLFRSWQSLDPDRLTIDVFQKLVDMKDPKKMDKAFWKEFVREMVFNVYQIPAFFMAVFSLILWWNYNKRSRCETITVIYEILMIGMLYFYLYFQGRYFQDRVDMGLWISFALVIFWMLTKKNDAFSLRAGLTTCSILIVVGLYIAYPRFRVNIDVPQKPALGREAEYDNIYKRRKNIEKIGKDQEHLYLAKVGCVKVETGYGPFDRLPKDIIANLCPMGGWTSRTASDNAILKRYHVENPYEDMIDNENVYLIDNDIKATMAYIRKWYSSDAKAKRVKTVGGCPIYKIVNEPIEEKSDKKTEDKKDKESETDEKKD